MKDKKKIILIVAAVIVLLLLPDIIKMSAKARKDKAQNDTSKQGAVQEVSVDSVADSNPAEEPSESKSEDDKTDGETSTAEAGTESSEIISEEEPQGPEHLEYFDYLVDDGMYPFTSGSNDFIFFEGNKYIAPFTTYLHLGEEPFTFSDKNVERIENSEFNSCVITADGKNYLFNQWTDDPMELNANSINPGCVHDSVTYMVPTSADGSVGQLYYMNAIFEEEQLVAENVVCDTAGITFWTPGYDDMRFLYVKEADGARTLIKAYCVKETIEKGDYKVYEKEVAQGNLIPIFIEHDSFYYYDQDKKELYYVKEKDDDSETKMIYSGDIDEYYVFERSSLYIVAGDDLFAYMPGDEEAKPVLSTGLESIRYHGTVSPFGYHGGHRVFADMTDCIMTDKNGKEYFASYSADTLVEPNRKEGEDKAFYYPGVAIAYVKDGVLYLDQYQGINEEGPVIETAILFDKEKVVDFCSDYRGRYTFVFTENRNVYCLNAEDKKVSLVDSGMDFSEDGNGGNFGFDYDNDYLLYSKDKVFYRYGVELESIQESLMSEGFITRDWNFIYFNSPGKEEKHFLYGTIRYDFR